MDPVTQGALGAVAAQAALGGRGGQRVWLAGAAGGLLPDADYLLRPLADPALPWELHRHFTHAYLMAPVMGLLAGGLLILLSRGFRRMPRLTLLAATLGALTHAPLDLLTSYGTKVYWPFSLENATLDLYPIVDPLFTLVLLVAVAWAARRATRTPALLACLFLALYTGAALLQRGRALDAQAALLACRRHDPVRARVLPLPGSLLAWRSLYEVDGRFVADVIRVAPGGGIQVAVGGEVPRATAAQVLARARDVARVREVLERFTHFAHGWIAFDPKDPGRVADMRFSAGPGFRPLWGLRLGAEGTEAVSWSQSTFSRKDVEGLWRTLWGTASSLRPLDEVAR